MDMIGKCFLLCLCATFAVALSACSPEVGSDRWCADLKGKPKGDWTVNEAKDFATNCILK